MFESLGVVMVVCCCFNRVCKSKAFFFFKQKTAYEMRISDWSSDVCSSDLIENGFKLYVQEQGGKLAGQELEYFQVDDESNPSKGPDNANRLIKRDQVDVLVGTVHSGVAMALAKAAKDSDTTLIIPNRSEEHTSELQSLMRISYAVFCLK